MRFLHILVRHTLYTHRPSLSRIAKSFSSETPYPRHRNRHRTQLQNPILLQRGGSLSHVHVEWEQWGDATLPGDRTIVIFPSFSHGSHVASNRDDPRPGWWQHLVGPRAAINSSHFRVICLSVIGSPFGATSPLSINPDTGKRYRASFPQVTPSDMALCHARVLDEIGINQVYAVIGGSMGGMQALEFAAQFPDRLKKLLILSCTAQSTPGTVAYRRVQRHAILADEAYNHGNYTIGSILEGMKVARELGLTCYRSREEFDARFDWRIQGDHHFKAISFDVEAYMDYKATKFARMYDPNCYLLLSKAMDLTNLAYGFTNVAEGLSRITCESLIIGVKQDQLIPMHEQASIANILQSHGRKASFLAIDSKFGHDAMFHPQIQANPLSEIVQQFLESDIKHTLSFEVHRYSNL